VIAIVDYRMGNLRSVHNAFAALGRESRVVDRPEELATADAIVLPGVGAFGDGIQNLRESGFVEALAREVRERGKPLLGICVGLQLLAEKGTEYGSHRGLGWVPGVVDRLPVPGGPEYRLPHIGWNDVRFTRTDGVFAGLGESATYYFVHSYALNPITPEVVAGVCDYGNEFVAAVEVDNITAVQFHPEKSHRAGLALLENWCRVAHA